MTRQKLTLPLPLIPAEAGTQVLTSPQRVIVPGLVGKCRDQGSNWVPPSAGMSGS